MKMKIAWSKITRFSAVMAASAGVLYAADSMTRFDAQPGSKMKIEGTSTLHDWTVEGGIIGGFFEADPGFTKDPAVVSKVLPKVEVEIPVRTLKSGSNPMNNVMYEAMKMKDHPKIKFTLKEMKFKGQPASGNGPFLFDTKGELTVSGVTRTNVMVVAVQKIADGQLKFAGTNTMKMTDFGIKPPAPAIALGAIKTGDEVKVSFEWMTAQGAAKAQ